VKRHGEQQPRPKTANKSKQTRACTRPEFTLNFCLFPWPRRLSRRKRRLTAGWETSTLRLFPKRKTKQAASRPPTNREPFRLFSFFLTGFLSGWPGCPLLRTFASFFVVGESRSGISLDLGKITIMRPQRKPPIQLPCTVVPQSTLEACIGPFSAGVWEAGWAARMHT